MSLLPIFLKVQLDMRRLFMNQHKFSSPAMWKRLRLKQFLQSRALMNYLRRMENC